MSRVCYRIRNWSKHYEKSDLKKTAQWSWVAFPNKHDGKGFRRLAHLPNKVAIFCGFVLMVQIASKMPVKGTLADEDGPLGFEDMAFQTGFPPEVFESACKWLTANKIEWIESGDLDAEGAFHPDTSGRHPETSGLQDRTGQDRTGQDRTGQTGGSSPRPPTPTPPAAPEETKPPVDVPFTRGDVESILAEYPHKAHLFGAVRTVEYALAELRREGKKDPVTFLRQRVIDYAQSFEGKRCTKQAHFWFQDKRWCEPDAAWGEPSPKTPAKGGSTKLPTEPEAFDDSPVTDEELERAKAAHERAFPPEFREAQEKRRQAGLAQARAKAAAKREGAKK